MATMWPSFWSRSTSASLSAGLTSPCTSSMPSFAPTALAVVRPSPVAITMRKPLACKVLMASSVVALMGSVTARMPASCLSTARCITLAPSLRRRSPSILSASVATPSCCINAVLPSTRCFPSTMPRTPIPLPDSKSSGLISSRPLARAALTMASAKGCSLPWSKLAARRRTSSAV